MKWRIHQNSIRIRLSESDIINLKEDGELVESLQIDNKKYSYRLILADQERVLLESNALQVTVGKKTLLRDDHVKITWIANGDLRVLVETDLYE